MPQPPPGVTLIHKPGQVQSKIIAVLPGIPRTDPDFWRLNLLMSVFGGSDSLLYTRLRDDLGIVYSAGFYQSARWEAGLLTGVIGCKGDQAAEAVLETVRIMNRLQAHVPPEELQQKRLDALNSFVFNVDTKAELVRSQQYICRQWWWWWRHQGWGQCDAQSLCSRWRGGWRHTCIRW